MNNKLLFWPLLIITVFLAIVLFMPKKTIWTTYSTEEFDKCRKNKEKFVVYFSGQECIGCQRTKKIIENSEVIQKTINKQKITMLYADIARKGVLSYLNSLNEDLVPLFVVYLPNGEYIKYSGELTEKEILDIL